MGPGSYGGEPSYEEEEKKRGSSKVKLNLLNTLNNNNLHFIEQS